MRLARGGSGNRVACMCVCVRVWGVMSVVSALFRYSQKMRLLNIIPPLAPPPLQSGSASVSSPHGNVAGQGLGDPEKGKMKVRDRGGGRAGGRDRH